eukprot:sb/3475331/
MLNRYLVKMESNGQQHGNGAPPTWAFGLCSCLDDIGLCCITIFVPCLTFGQTAEMLGDDCLMAGVASMVPLLNLYCFLTVRGRVREKFGIEGSVINDLLMICCCPQLSLIQMARQARLQPGQQMERV